MSANPPNGTADFTEKDIDNLRSYLLTSAKDPDFPISLSKQEILYIVACLPATCAAKHRHESMAEAFICNSGGGE